MRPSHSTFKYHEKRAFYTLCQSTSPTATSTRNWIISPIGRAYFNWSIDLDFSHGLNRNSPPATEPPTHQRNESFCVPRVIIQYWWWSSKQPSRPAPQLEFTIITTIQIMTSPLQSQQQIIVTGIHTECSHSIILNNTQDQATWCVLARNVEWHANIFESISRQKQAMETDACELDCHYLYGPKR